MESAIPIMITQTEIEDYICITDIAGTTLEFLSTWEEIYNPNFKVFESEYFKKQTGLLTFNRLAFIRRID